MKRGLREFVSVALILFGLAISLPTLRLTGFAILTGEEAVARVVGVIFVVSGLFLFVSRRRVSVLEERLEEVLPNIGRVVRPVMQKKAVIFLDSDFLTQVYQMEKQGSAKVGELSKWNVVMPKRVAQELSYVPPWRRASLVPSKFLNYLTNKCGVRVEDIGIEEDKVRRKVEDYIVELWKELTPQGKEKAYDPGEEQKFRHSADIRLLSYAVTHPDQDVIILSNNSSEIERIGEALNAKKQARVYVFGTKQLLY